MARYTARFIAIQPGTNVELNDLGIFGVSGKHKVLGFKPGPAGEASGWLVVLVSGGSKPARIDRTAENMTAMERLVVAARGVLPFLSVAEDEDLKKALEPFESTS